MRTLRLVSLLLIATCAFAQNDDAREVITTSTALSPHALFQVDVRSGNATAPHLVQQPGVFAAPWTRGADARLNVGDAFRTYRADNNTCYFIRSYIMKREGETGATHLDRVTTCTPKSKIRMKTKVKFTPAFTQ